MNEADKPALPSLRLDALHRNAPLDDEPETEEEKARVAEANAEYERGEYVTLEEVREELEF